MQLKRVHHTCWLGLSGSCSHLAALTTLSVPHWLLEKWGMLDVKWCVTDEAALVTLCSLWESPHPRLEGTSGYSSTLASFFFLLFSDSSQKVTFKLLLSESCSKPELNKQSVLRHMKLDLELMVVMLHSLSESANKQSTSLLQRGQVNKESATAGRHSSLGW